LLARQGKIDAYKEGRNWLTTKKAVEDYITEQEERKIELLEIEKGDSKRITFAFS
jgi:hypothetical protein